jgi:lipoprotein NlpI
MAYYEKYDFDRAIADFDQIVKLRSSYVIATVARSSVADLQRGFERSVSDVSPQFALNPVFAFAFNDRGIAFVAKGDLDRGIADFDQAIKINGTYATASTIAQRFW